MSHHHRSFENNAMGKFPNCRGGQGYELQVPAGLPGDVHWQFANTSGGRGHGARVPWHYSFFGLGMMIEPCVVLPWRRMPTSLFAACSSFHSFKYKFTIKLAGIGLPLTCFRRQDVLTKISSEKRLNNFDSFGQHRAHNAVRLPSINIGFSVLSLFFYWREKLMVRTDVVPSCSNRFWTAFVFDVAMVVLTGQANEHFTTQQVTSFIIFYPPKIYHGVDRPKLRQFIEPLLQM